MGRTPPSAALPPAEGKCGREQGCAPVGLRTPGTARTLQLMVKPSLNNFWQAPIYRRKGLVGRKPPDYGRREKINKVLLWFGAEFLNLMLVFFLLINFSYGTKELKKKIPFPCCILLCKAKALENDIISAGKYEHNQQCNYCPSVCIRTNSANRLWFYCKEKIILVL